MYSVAVVFPSTQAVAEMWEEKHHTVYANKDISERNPKHRTALSAWLYLQPLSRILGTSPTIKPCFHFLLLSVCLFERSTFLIPDHQGGFSDGFCRHRITVVKFSYILKKVWLIIHTSTIRKIRISSHYVKLSCLLRGWCFHIQSMVIWWKWLADTNLTPEALLL